MLIGVREARAADMPALRALWVAAWQATLPAIDFAARGDWLEARLAALRGAGAVLLCAVDPADRVLGFVTAAPGEIDQLAVSPDRFGTGVAGMLLDEAKRRSPSGLRLTVNQDNPRAVRFYAREGFAVSGRGWNAMSGLAVWTMTWG